MVPLHLAMIRAWWFCRMHGIRLIASCSHVALTCRSSGAILARKALNVVPIRPWVSTMVGVTTASLYLVLGVGGCLALFSSGFHTER